MNHVETNNSEGKHSVKSAFELLMEAPDDQIVRCKIAMRAIAAGQWGEAGFTLANAVAEAGGQWATDADELAKFCEIQAVATATK